MVKLISKILFAIIICTPAMAADSSVSERQDCDTMQSRISELAAIESPTDAQSDELAKLQAQYRTNCSKSAGGRRATTTSRISMATMAAAAATPVAAPTTTKETVVVNVGSVLKDYLADLQKLCDDLSSDIEMLADNGTSDGELKPLQNQYNANCKEIDKSKTAELDVETITKNVNAGLCEDGSKPNKFGCCGDEIFTDMGNLVFACCPESGGECHPPLNDGNAL